MRHQRISQEELSSCRCSTTSPVDQETMKKNASQMLNSFLYMQKDLEKDNSHYLVLVQRKSGLGQSRICNGGGPEESNEYVSQTTGFVEEAVRTVERKVRTLKFSVEEPQA